MAKPHEMTQKFAQIAANRELLDILWRKNRLAYIRTRLHAIRLLWDGYSRQEVIDTLHIGHSTIIRWMRVLVEYGADAGLHQLTMLKKAPKSGKLSYEQQHALIAIIEQKKPSDYGFESHIFTGAMLVQIVAREWGITLTDQTIYNILERNEFSYQRGHRDYEPADPDEQHTYGERLKKSSKHPKRVRKSSSLTNSGSRTDQPSSMVGRG